MTINYTNMEKGKWYKLGNGRHRITGEWYIEFDKYDDSPDQYVKATRYINVRSPRHNSSIQNHGKFSKKGDYSTTEVHKSEIQEFLPIEERELVINNYSLW